MARSRLRGSRLHYTFRPSPEQAWQVERMVQCTDNLRLLSKIYSSPGRPRGTKTIVIKGARPELEAVVFCFNVSTGINPLYRY